MTGKGLGEVPAVCALGVRDRIRAQVMKMQVRQISLIFTRRHMELNPLVEWYAPVRVQNK